MPGAADVLSALFFIITWIDRILWLLSRVFVRPTRDDVVRWTRLQWRLFFSTLFIVMGISLVLSFVAAGFEDVAADTSTTLTTLACILFCFKPDVQSFDAFYDTNIKPALETFLKAEAEAGKAEALKRGVLGLFSYGLFGATEVFAGAISSGVVSVSTKTVLPGTFFHLAIASFPGGIEQTFLGIMGTWVYIPASSN